LPVPSILPRYFMASEGWPLGAFVQIAGPEGCYKSTTAIEILRWHRMCNGKGTLLEAETKPTPDLRNAILNWDVDAVYYSECDSMNEWMWKNQELTSDFKDACVKADVARLIPYCTIIDSILGKATDETRNKIIKEGSPGRMWGNEARELNLYMKKAPGDLRSWPFSLVGVNHLKMRYDEYGNPDYNIPGGWALKFHTTMTWVLSKIGRIKEFANHKEATIGLRMLKNSRGQEHMTAQVKLKLWRQMDEGVDRLHGRFEWWSGAIDLLKFGTGMSKPKAARLLPKIKEVLDIKEKSGTSPKRYHCKELGVSPSDAMLPHDLGMQLERCPQVLTDLYPILEIERRPFFQPGVDYLTQQDSYEHIAEQAMLAKEHADRAEQLLQKAKEIGKTDGVVPEEEGE